VHTFHDLALKKAFSVKIIVIVIRRKAKLFDLVEEFAKTIKIKFRGEYIFDSQQKGFSYWR